MRRLIGDAMSSKDELKRAVCEAIDRNGNQIIKIGERILHHPEIGFNDTQPPRSSLSGCAPLGSIPKPASP
jgi:hypothetical protein